MNTKQAIESLNDKHKTFLENRKEVLSRTDKPDDVKGEIRGYLRGIANCGDISELDFRLLLTFYTMI